jgi:hypothetical protein
MDEPVEPHSSRDRGDGIATQAGENTGMRRREPRYRIDPIEPGEIGVRFGGLLDRLEPVLGSAAVGPVRSLVELGSYRDAFERLDALTDASELPIETEALVELVLLGQAIRGR